VRSKHEESVSTSQPTTGPAPSATSLPCEHMACQLGAFPVEDRDISLWPDIEPDAMLLLTGSASFSVQLRCREVDTMSTTP
jgi:hypothetical protein